MIHRRVSLTGWLPGVALALSVSSGATAQNLDMGRRFHELDREVLRLTMWFTEGHSVSERAPDGRITARMFDEGGHLVAELATGLEPGRLDVDTRADGRVEHVAVPDRRMLATDWHNIQIHRLWRDRRTEDAIGVTSPVVWDGGSLRLQGQAQRGLTADGRSMGDPDEVVSVQSEFADYVATAMRDPIPGRPKPGTAYSTFTARLRDRRGQELGFVRYFSRQRVVTWSFVSGDRGVVQETRLPGGFRFTPNMAWANLQGLALHRDRPLAHPGPPLAVVARAGGLLGTRTLAFMPTFARPRAAAEQPGAAGLSFRPAAERSPFAPAGLHGRRYSDNSAEMNVASSGVASQPTCDGQSDGCTGLHWLDGSIFRACCDAHDICFEYDPENGGCCTKWSWIAFWDNWHCTACNAAVVACFITGGGGGGSGGGGGGGDPEACVRHTGEWCPPECMSCTEAP